MACCGEKNKMECVIGNYHVYKATCIWPAVIREELVCTREAMNVADRQAITVISEEIII